MVAPISVSSIALRLLVALAALVAAPGQAATVSLCESAGLAGNGGKEMYGPEGRLVVLAVSDDAAPAANCAAAELPAPAAAVRWFTLTDIPAAGPAPDRLGLQGFFDAAEARVSEVIHAQAEMQGEPGFLPFNTDIQPYLRSRAFGVEERATLAGNLLSCAAGAQVAGVTLHSDYLWEQLPGTTLEVRASGSGEFSVAIADPPRERRELPLELGAVRAGDDTVTAHYALPDNDRRWTSLVIFCPQAAASLTLESLKLQPAPSSAVERRRATWLWSPELWRSAPETAWRIARDENVHKVFVTIPVDDSGAVANTEQLAAFIREARARDLEVWAVAGDRADVLPESLPPLLARAAAYRRFNEEHADAAIAGLQLDIEPYLLPGITLAPDYWRQRYVATITAVHASLAGRLPLDLVMPVWWGTHPAWGSRLLEALALPDLSVTVMNYRTNADALRAGAMPFLAWGREHGRRITMALEKGRAGVNAGNGRDETRISYAPAAAGELWMLELGGIALLVLLDEVYAGLPGQAYAKTDERVISTGTISFAGAPDNLQVIADTLEAEWSAWDSFAGLAIHGLDQAATEGE